MKTFRAKPGKVEQKWYVVDASDKILGRLSTEIAKILRGKNKTIYSPDVDCGDFVIVINAEKIKVTGQKEEQKLYYRHSGYPGGLKQQTFREKIQKHPEEIIKQSVKGMLPHNRLGRTMLKKLKVFAGDKHTHEAQKPEVIDIQTSR